MTTITENTLIFDGADVRRLIDHAEASTDWTQGWGDADTGAHPRPQIMFVHDQGLYLMSNGNAPDLPEAQRVIYAKGFDPSKGPFEEWWEGARAIVGGDDFVEYIDTASLMLPNSANADIFFIEVDGDEMTLGWIS